MNDNRYVNPVMCLECYQWFYPNGSGALCENCKLKNINNGYDSYER